MKHLALYLKAPLQSWGASSKFGDRGTRNAPTRSGLLGLLAAACGIDKNDDAIDRAWLDRASTLAVRAFAFQRGGRMADYHTVGGGFDKDRPWQKRRIPVKSDGKPRGTDVTHRDYLEDSVFGAVLSGDDALLAEMAAGIDNPVWGVWLGRKCCIPSEPVFAGLYDSEEEAHASLEARFRASLDRTGKTLETTGQANALRFADLEVSAEEADETLLDVPVSFARREFRSRRIRRDFPDAGDESKS